MQTPSPPRPSPLFEAPERLKQLLLAEDNVVAGLGLKAELVAHGYSVVGPIASVDEVLAVASLNPPSAAILDFQLRDRNSLPIADALSRIGVPFCFLTGFSNVPELDRAFSEVRVLTKPVDVEDILQFLEGIAES